jgi:hypothetical protein
MPLSTQVLNSTQEELDAPELLSVEDILPEDCDPYAAEEEVLQAAFWNRDKRFANNMVLRYVHAVENNWTTPETAVADMLSFGVLPCETVVEMLGVFLRASAKMEA